MSSFGNTPTPDTQVAWTEQQNALEPPFDDSTQSSTQSRGVAFLGCHGGAGATTLAELVPGAKDLGVFNAKSFDTQTSEEPLVLVTKDSVPASTRVTETVNVLGFLGYRIAALVVVAEAPNKIPANARSRLRLLEGQIPTLVFFPYVSRFRYVNIPDVISVRIPRKARAAIDELIAVGERSGQGSQRNRPDRNN